jgi:uncharacterized protein (TIGR02145 family)
MKRLSICSILLLLVFAAGAQAPETVNGFAVGGGIDATTGSEVIIGQPFTQFAKTADYNATLGIGQSQLVRTSINALINQGEEYTANGFNYPSTTAAGTYKDTTYIKLGSHFNYDSTTTLRLVVLGAFTCGDTIYDVDLNEYQTVEVAGYCWTKENLKATHYADGTSEITGIRIYNDDNTNLPIYGRLYTWYGAVKLPEGSSDAPTTVDGFVQGACPDGWHIPTSGEMTALGTVNTHALNATTLWVGPHASENTNASGFTAVPAGKYNAELSRYEGLGTEANFWGDSGTYSPSTLTTLAHIYTCAYYCDGLLANTLNAYDGASIRCVRNH